MTTGAAPGGPPAARPRPIRMVLGDPQRALVEALSLRLDAEPGVQVVASGASPEELVRAVRGSPVDVAVLGVDAPGVLLAAGEAMAAADPGVRLVAMTEGEDVTVLGRAVRAGFRGWVHKEAGVGALLDVVSAVQRGETRIPPFLLTPLLDHLLHEEEQRRAAAAPLAALTARELDVLRAMVRGRSRAEIADQLAISVNTVRSHSQAVLTKLGVHSALAAVTLARRAGIE